MARVTVEDCLEKVGNRFDLTMIAAKRAHQLCAGTHSSLINSGKDKPSVIALREIAEGLIDYDILATKTTTFGTTSLEDVQEELNTVAVDEKADELNIVEE